MKNKQNSRSSDGNPRRKGDFRHEKGKPPPTKQNDGKKKGARPSTGGGRSNEDIGEASHKNSGPADPTKYWGCGRIGYRRSFCPDCSGNETRRD